MTASRISLLTEIPAPFRIPLFNALAANADVTLDVLFVSEQDPKRPYPVYASEFAFGWRVLRGRQLPVKGRWVVLSRGVVRALWRFRPTAIIVGGWNQPAFWSATLFATVTRTPVIAWVESTARDTRPATFISELPKRLLIRACSSFVVPGTASADYLAQLGVAQSRIIVAPNAIDAHIFGKRVDELRMRRHEVRSELAIDGPLVLYVGRLDREKGLDVLIRAADNLNATVAIVGRGPEEAVLREHAPANVRFVGWVARDDLPPWYAAADVFVLPSHSDQWGMVLNEAAAAGLPLVATEAPGAAHNLIDEGVNGFRTAVGDVRALHVALERVLADGELRASAGARSKEIASLHTPERWAEAMLSAARRVEGAGGKLG